MRWSGCDARPAFPSDRARLGRACLQSGVRPRRVVAVVGTGTDVGKTWVAARLLARPPGGGPQRGCPQAGAVLRRRRRPGHSRRSRARGGQRRGPRRRLPAASLVRGAHGATDGGRGAGPPALQHQRPGRELRWPAEPVDVGLVETAGGLRSPLAADGDCLALCRALAPDIVVLVADAGLGTINAVRLTAGALAAVDAPVVVVLNRFDAGSDPARAQPSMAGRTRWFQRGHPPRRRGGADLSGAGWGADPGRRSGNPLSNRHPCRRWRGATQSVPTRTERDRWDPTRPFKLDENSRFARGGPAAPAPAAVSEFRCGRPVTGAWPLQIVRRSRQISALHREQLTDIAEFDRAESWRGDGAVSMVAWVTAQCGVSTSTARQWVRSAVTSSRCPASVRRWRQVICRWTLWRPWRRWHRPRRTLPCVKRRPTGVCARPVSWWRGTERRRRMRRLQEPRAAGEPERNDSEAECSAAREFDRRTLRFNDTRRTIWVAFTRDDYAAAKSSLVGRVSADKRERERERERVDDDEVVGAASMSDPLGYVPYDQRLYDALMDLFRVGSAPAGGTGERRTVRPRVRGARTGRAVAGLFGSRSRSRSSSRRPCAREREWARPRSRVWDRSRPRSLDAWRATPTWSSRWKVGDGSILDQGRARRDPTPAQRMEIARRDKGCRFPGCCFTEFTTVHHLHHWANGGETNMDNLITLCDRHHRAVHELGWSMSGDADAAVTFTSPHGRAMRSVPSPTWRMSSVRSLRDPPMRR